MEIKEQISEEFARELINEVWVNSHKLEVMKQKTLENWERLGYIKQSREEEIRDLLEKPYMDHKQICDRVKLLEELIEILDNKIKESKE